MKPASRSTKHVLFATAYFPPYAPGGAEHSTEALAFALQERGLQVTVATPRLGPLEHPTLPVIRIDAGFRMRDGKELVRSRTFLRPDVQLRLARGYSRAIRASGASIVHCQNLAVLPAAFLAARRRRIPIVVTVRDLSAVCPLAVCLLSQSRVPHDCSAITLQRRCVDEYSRAYGTRRLRTRVSSLVGFAVSRFRARLLRHADARIFVGSDLASLHRDAGLIAPDSTVHVTGNIAASPHVPAQGGGAGRYAVYAGKISVGKGFGVLLDALPQIEERCGDFRLVCFGRADESWQRRIASNPSVDYRGSVAHASVLDAYRGARIAVVPSVWPEPLPRAVLEAQSAGVPVVATRSGGIADAVSDERNGLLVPPGDPEALARAVTRLWDDEGLRSRLAGNGRASVVRRFSAEAVCGRTIAAYDEALGTRLPEEGGT